MSLPSVLIDISNLATGIFHWNGVIPTGMSPRLVVKTLVSTKFVLQVSRSPKQGLIQKFSPYTANQSLNEWMRHWRVWK
tara:strand:+ start:3808 stop:4044 length:237 start_codon:yes stop_codon:yes gene_type:complete